MNAYRLPTSLNIGGVDFNIRTDFRVVLGVFEVVNDPELDNQYKNQAMIRIMIIDWEKVPHTHIEEALKKICEFIDCGIKGNDKPSPRLVDWNQDAGIIIPAVNNIAKTEIRALEYLHWWTFLGYYMEIRESLFSSVLSIRGKLAKHKKLESYEKEFYRENRSLIDMNSSAENEETDFWEELLNTGM